MIAEILLISGAIALPVLAVVLWWVWRSQDRPMATPAAPPHPGISSAECLASLRPLSRSWAARARIRREECSESGRMGMA